MATVNIGQGNAGDQFYRYKMPRLQAKVEPVLRIGLQSRDRRYILLTIVKFSLADFRWREEATVSRRVW